MNAKNMDRNLRNAISFRAMLGCGKGFKYRRHGARWLCCKYGKRNPLEQ